MFSFEEIYKAYKDCVKHKRNTLNALSFEANLVENICNLEEELNAKTYKIGKSICFLASSPKLREIFAADFRDRVVHHLLVNKIEPLYEKKFIYDVYNNRKNKGIHGAMKRAKSFMNGVGNDGYYLQLDIKGFFYNLDKNILFKHIFFSLHLSRGVAFYIVCSIVCRHSISGEMEREISFLNSIFSLHLYSFHLS